MSWKNYVNIYTVGGAAGGAYLGHSKYGKKHGYTASIVGALGGAVAGVIVQKLVGGRAPVAANPQLAAQQRQQVSSGTGEFVDLDFTDGPQETPPPPPPNAPPQQRAEYEAAQAAFENLGSLSGGDGLGSLSGNPGFDADEIDYDEILADVERQGGGGYN